MKENDFKYEPFDEAEIDPHELDEEWLRLPSAYHYYSDFLANLQEKKEEASNKLDSKKSELDNLIRSDPGLYDMAKLTEATVAGKVNELISDTEEWKEFLNIRKQYNQAQNKIKALDKKDRALNALVSLFQSSYFVGPKEPKILKKGSRGITEEKIQERKTKAIEKAGKTKTRKRRN